MSFARLFLRCPRFSPVALSGAGGGHRRRFIARRYCSLPFLPTKSRESHFDTLQPPTAQRGTIADDTLIILTPPTQLVTLPSTHFPPLPSSPFLPRPSIPIPHHLYHIQNTTV